MSEAMSENDCQGLFARIPRTYAMNEIWKSSVGAREEDFALGWPFEMCTDNKSSGMSYDRHV